MTLFAFNEKSILNNSFVRSVNGIILFILYSLFISNESTPPIKSYWQLIFIIVFGSVCMVYCYDKTIRGTHFFDEQKKERDKKLNFILIYIMIATPLSSSLAMAIAILYETLVNMDLYYNSWIAAVIPIPIFVFNLVNIPSLFYPAFEKELKIS